MYDLTILEREAPKRIDRLTQEDISRYLGEANSSATRKRRLTSLRQFYRFLVEEALALTVDPTADIFPNQIELRQPQPMSPTEQEALLRSAGEDEAWALPAILLMMRSGLTRAEILTLDRGDVDRSGSIWYSVRIETDDLRKPNRTRTLLAGMPFPEAYEAYLENVNPEGRLFPVGFQAVNGMVDRVRRRAKIGRTVTPRSLRETFIASRLADGATEVELLPELGLAMDLRNRQSLRRFRPALTQPAGSDKS